MRLYLTPRSREESDVLEVMRLYGLPPVVQTDGQGRYVDLTPPDHWLKSRGAMFKKAIKRARNRAGKRRGQ